jgi:transcription elongation factor GreA
MAKKTYYITKEKLKELKKEYEQLIETERVKTVGQEAPKLFESEDMNPEFVSFQEDIGTLRGRLDELKDIIEGHELIKAPPKSEQHVVAMGASVKVDAAGKPAEFTIVGTLDADPEEGKISNESPVGKALLGKTVGEEVKVPAPVEKAYKIKAIKYEIG